MEKFLQKLGSYASSFDKKRLSFAFDLASKSGVDVSALLNILSPLCPDEDTLIASLLQHGYSSGIINEKEINELFGHGVLSILNDVKKLDGLQFSINNRNSQVEVLRKLFLAMAKDMRVIFVCLIYRFYKLNHYAKFNEKKSHAVFAKETLNLYVPVADRLGINLMKKQLEDAAFKYGFPREYEDVSNALKKVKERKSVSISLIQKELSDFFEARGFKCKDVQGRTKGYYSVYKKMKAKGSVSLDGLYDIFAIRVVLPNKIIDSKEQLDHLYAALGLMHSKWTPLSTRFKDYVVNPKPNGYRSLHTVLIGLAPKDMEQPVEVQIRTEGMHEDAEYGIASHWIYKESGSGSMLSESQADLIKNLQSVRSDNEILSEVEVDIFKDKIFVLTPSGEVKSLPAGAGPIDFAYCVHTDVGNHCIMAKVDGRVVPLDYELRNGEIVEVVTRKDAEPKLQWLSLVKTNGAKNKIKAWFNFKDRENNIRKGKKMLNERLVSFGYDPLDQHYTLLKNYLGKKLSVVDRESLIEEIGKGSKMTLEVLKKIFPARELASLQTVKKAKKEREFSGLTPERRVLVGGEKDLPLKLANCCKPVDGSSITAYVTRGNSLTIHRSSCLILNSLNPARMLEANWRQSLELQ